MDNVNLVKLVTSFDRYIWIEVPRGRLMYDRCTNDIVLNKAANYFNLTRYWLHNSQKGPEPNGLDKMVWVINSFITNLVFIFEVYTE